jgi:hypothetical protein
MREMKKNYQTKTAESQFQTFPNPGPLQPFVHLIEMKVGVLSAVS